MITYELIADRVTNGETPSEIAAYLRDSGLTANDIPLKGSGGLRWFLRENGLLLKGLSVPFTGAIAEFAETAPAEVIQGLLEFATHVFDDSNAMLSTTDTVIAARGKALITALSSVMTAEQITAFYALGGGLAYANVTADDVSDVITSHNAAVTRESLQLLLENAILAAQSSFATGGDKAQITSAFDGVMNG